MEGDAAVTFSSVLPVVAGAATVSMPGGVAGCAMADGASNAAAVVRNGARTAP